MKKMLALLALPIIFGITGCDLKGEGSEFLGDWEGITHRSKKEKISITMTEKGAIKISYIERVADGYISQLGSNPKPQKYKDKIRTYFPTYKKGVLFVEPMGTLSLSNDILNVEQLKWKHAEFKRKEEQQESSKK